MKKDRYQTGLTDAEKEKPYAEYFYRPPARIADDVMQALRLMDPQDTLPFERKNDLLAPGYHKCETGYCWMPDGSCYVAVLTRMPGVTGDMLDWWFWWHALEDLRYKIWFPGAHVAISAKDPGQLRNTALSARERYWNNPHYPVEDIGIGMEKLSITFMPPEDVGFDIASFAEAGIATAICTRVGSVTKHSLHTDMCHVVRTTADGVEMRSRFWIGRNLRFTPLSERSPIQRLINTKFFRKIVIPADTPAQMAHHCAQEYSNLAAILPELYRNYGGVESK
jgi:hypothetical protein